MFYDGVAFAYPKGFCYLDKTVEATVTVRYPRVTDVVVNSAPIAIKGEAYAAGKEAEAIKSALLGLSRRARKGAKVYISRSMSLEMTFEKGEDGHYIFPIYNNTGITTIATVPVEVDENLADGDFVVGNAKNYKLNFVKPTEIYPEIHGKTRVIEYTAHVMVAGKAAPNKFYYGKKANA